MLPKQAPIIALKIQDKPKPVQKGKKPHKVLRYEIGVAHHFLWCSPVQELMSDFDFLLCA